MRVSLSSRRRAALNYNRRCYANAFKAHAVNLHVLDGQQQQPSANEKCGCCKASHGAGGELGVYYILKSMEQGPTFRVTVPKYPTKDANYRILARQRSRFTHYYFYIRDEALGPMVMRVASFLPFQTTPFPLTAMYRPSGSWLLQGAAFVGI